jgi:hypothetical protein
MQKRIGHFSEISPAKIDIFPREEKQFSRPLPQPRKLLDHVRDVLRVNHYSARTEGAYIGWIRRYILYHNKKHPREMGALEAELYLTHLAVGEKVSTNTQKQALNALDFLYHRVLQKPLGRFRDIERPKRRSVATGVKQGGGRADFARHEWNPSVDRNAFVRHGNAVTGMPALTGKRSRFCGQSNRGPGWKRLEGSDNDVAAKDQAGAGKASGASEGNSRPRCGLGQWWRLFTRRSGAQIS